jgi:hypothetical protein
MDYNRGTSIMKNAWLFGTLLGFRAALRLTQTTEDLVNDGRNSFTAISR